MANVNKISVVITADPSGAITGMRLAGDETEKFGTRSKSALQLLKENWMAVTAGAYAAYKAFQQIWGLMERAAQIDEAMSSLDALTRQYGMTAQDLVGTIREQSRGLIGMGAAAKTAGDALMKGLNPDQLAHIASWSVSISHIRGGTIKAAESFDMLSSSIATGRERGLKALVGIVDLEEKYGKYAETMSKAEKAQAMYTIAAERMAQVQATLGEEVDSAADRMERFNNSIDRAKYFFGSLLLVIGQPFMAVIQVAMTLVYGLAGAFDTLVSTGARVTDWLHLTEGATDRWAKKADIAYGNAAQSAIDALNNIKGAWQSLSDMGRVGGPPLPGPDTGRSRKSLDQLNEMLRKYAEERELIDAAEKDRELIKLDFWFEEQRKKLQDLGAENKHYSELVRLYAEKRHKDIADQAIKISEFYLEVQRNNAKESDEIEKQRSAALFREHERSARERMEIDNIYLESFGGTEEDLIRRYHELFQRLVKNTLSS